MNIFKFEPIYKERIWGGTKIRDSFHRSGINGENIGESWDVVDREEDNSILANTSFRGKTLSDLLRSEGKTVMGPHWNEGYRFPLLVKWLDCAERLSLQVHPPKKVAGRLNGEPKTENWYVAEASEEAGLFIGLKKGTEPEAFLQAIQDGKAETFCHRTESQKGDSVLVESGRLHAIDGGNLILEIQQNSDTTYRVFDWKRLGLDGRPRSLHVEESMKCIDFDDCEPELISTNTQKGIEVIAESDHFRIKKVNIHSNDSIVFKEINSDPLLIHLLEGRLQVNHEFLSKGEHALCPFSSSCLVTSNEDCSFLVTDRFSRHAQ